MLAGKHRNSDNGRMSAQHEELGGRRTPEIIQAKDHHLDEKAFQGWLQNHFPTSESYAVPLFEIRDHWNFGFCWSAARADDSQFLARENTHILNTRELPGLKHS